MNACKMTGLRFSIFGYRIRIIKVGIEIGNKLGGTLYLWPWEKRKINKFQTWQKEINKCVEANENFISKEEIRKYTKNRIAEILDTLKDKK